MYLQKKTEMTLFFSASETNDKFLQKCEKYIDVVLILYLLYNHLKLEYVKINLLVSNHHELMFVH